MNEVREILANEMRFLDETLDQMEMMDVRHNHFKDWDMADLMSFAYQLDQSNRENAKAERRQEANRRLCRIIAGKYQRAIAENDFDECDRLADELVVATRMWGGV